jgi:hypothetical protein
VVVILSIITVYSLTEEWFMSFLLYCIPLLFQIWQRSGGVGYIVYQYCLDLTEEWVLLLLYIVYHNYCFRFDRGVVHVLVGSIVYHYCLNFSQRSGSCFGWLYCLPLLFKVLINEWFMFWLVIFLYSTVAV